jgi:hypothetical protein
MRFIGYTLKRSAPKGHYAEFRATFESEGTTHTFDKHTLEEMARNSSKHREQAEFALEHWPAMS